MLLQVERTTPALYLDWLFLMYLVLTPAVVGGKGGGFAVPTIIRYAKGHFGPDNVKRSFYYEELDSQGSTLSPMVSKE